MLGFGEGTLGLALLSVDSWLRPSIVVVRCSPVVGCRLPVGVYQVVRGRNRGAAASGFHVGC
jgi:hypothetical protein